MEPNKEKRDWIAILILVVGAIFRLLLCFYNPPNNAYDDYLEPIAYYINLDIRPNPATCWECYQPPLYFYIAEAIYKTSFLLSSDYYFSWKAVQLFNSLLSICTLVIIYKILLKMFSKERNIVLIVLSIVCIYPRDLYTSAMISNDTLLVFYVSLSVYFFLCYCKSESTILLVSLCLSVLAASLTKQHGLITILLLVAVSTRYIMFDKGKILKLLTNPCILLPFITSILCLGDEFWKYQHTHQFLISNQHFYNYVSTQLPGSLDKIEFFTFRFSTLLNDPFLSSNTIYSFWTVLFASAWFDYEWRYTTPDLYKIKYISNLLYTYAILILSVWVIGIIKLFLKKIKINFHTVVLLIVGACFFLVPLIQTLRFPYYSSMKSLFFLPALSIMAMALVFGLQQFPWIKKTTVAYSLIGCTLCIGIIHVAYVLSYLYISLPNLSGPLWIFPGINL